MFYLRQLRESLEAGIADQAYAPFDKFYSAVS
jgi:hypothetical protein